jgi:hypothetical protein
METREGGKETREKEALWSREHDGEGNKRMGVGCRFKMEEEQGREKGTGNRREKRVMQTREGERRQEKGDADW